MKKIQNIQNMNYGNLIYNKIKTLLFYSMFLDTNLGRARIIYTTDGRARRITPFGIRMGRGTGRERDR